MGSYNEPNLDNWWEQPSEPAGEPQGSVTVTGAPADVGGSGQDINQIYQQYLGRDVDPSGAQTYAGFSNQDIINAIQGSPEYANYIGGGGGGGVPTGGTDINALYNQYLGRNVDPSGASTFAGKSADEIIAGITGSQEYASRGGAPSGALPTTLDYGSMTPEQTVSDIYRKVLGREADEGAKGWIEDIRGGTSALELAQRLQASDEGKAYLAANPELAYKAMAGLSQQNAPFKKEGDQFGYNEPIRDSEGNIIGQQFNPTIDFSGLKYTGSPTRTVGGGESGTGQTSTTHQYEDGKGGTITVDDRGNMISYTPSIQWYAEQNAKYPDAVRQGYRNYSYMSTGPIDQTIKIMGQDVPIEAQEYMTNDKGQLVVDKGGNLIPMVREPNTQGGWDSAMNKIIDAGIMAAGTLGGGPLGAAAASGLVGLKNETPTNQMLRNAAIAAGTTWAAGQLLPTSSVPVGDITASQFPSAAFQLTEQGANAANLALQNAPAYVFPALNAAGTVANTATNTAPSAVAPAVAPSSVPAWLEAAQRGAIVGGTMGGVNAVLSGQNPLQGIGTGIVTGAIGGGSNSALGGGFLGNVGSGILSGATGAALNKQNIGTGAAYGAGGGALNYLATSPYAPDWAKNPMIRNAITGGALSVARGDDFTKGMASGVIGGYIGNQANNYINSLFPSTNAPTQAPTNAPILKSEDTNAPLSQEIRVANQPTETDLEAQRGTQPNAPLARLASYTPLEPLPMPDFEDIYPVEPSEGVQRPQGVYSPGDVIQSKVNPDSTLTVNEDFSVTVRTPEGEFVVPTSEAYNVLRAVDDANNIDYSQGDTFTPDPRGEYAKYGGGALQYLPNWNVNQPYDFEFPQMENPALTGGQGANSRMMQETAAKGPNVTVEMLKSPEMPSNAPKIAFPTEAEIQALDTQAERASALNLNAAGPMSEPADTEKALIISESAVVQANASPEEQAIIDQLKDIITSYDTSQVEKDQAAEELKNIAGSIASRSGVEGGDLDGQEKGVLGGDKNGIAGGVLGGRGIQPGTAGGYYGEEPNPGLDKQDMDEEPEPEPEEPFIDPNDLSPELPPEEPPEEPSKTTPRTNLPRQPIPIKKPVYPSQIPGYSWNQNISGALPGNLNATMLAGAPTQEGRRMLQQLKQLYPQLSTIDPQLLQTLSSRVGTGSGGGALSTPAPGYPDQAAGKTTFAQSNMPASFSALGSAGLQALGGASNPNIAGYADGGDVHIPEFKTGTTGHYVQGRGDGQSDEIPAMLANGEYVFDADTVAALGNGSNEAGAKALDKMREAIRKHKRSAPHTKIPPKAKSPLEYLKGK